MPAIDFQEDAPAAPKIDFQPEQDAGTEEPKVDERELVTASQSPEELAVRNAQQALQARAAIQAAPAGPPTLTAAPVSPWARFRAGPTGHKLFGPTPMERESSPDLLPGGEPGLVPMLLSAPLPFSPGPETMAGKALLGGMIAQFASSAPGQYQAFKDAVARGDNAEARDIAVEAGFGAAFSGMAAKGLWEARPGNLARIAIAQQAKQVLPQAAAEAAKNITTERIQDARSQQEAAEVHGDVRPQQEPAQGVPVQESSSGVLPQAQEVAQEPAEKVLLKPEERTGLQDELDAALGQETPPAPATPPVEAKGAAPFKMTFEQFLKAPREGPLLEALRKLPRPELTPEQKAAVEMGNKATAALEKAKLTWIYDRSEPSKRRMVESAIAKLPKSKKKLVDAYEAALDEAARVSGSREAGQRKLYDRAVAAGIIESPPPSGQAAPIQTPPRAAGSVGSEVGGPKTAIPPGPGAQTAGTDLPLPAQQAIAEALKTLPTPSTIGGKFNMAEKAAEAYALGKDGWQKAIAKARGAGAMMHDLLLGKTKLDTFDNLAYQHEAMKQRASANAKTVRREALKRFKSEDEREAMNNWLQAQVFPNPELTLQDWTRAAQEKAAAVQGIVDRLYWRKVARRYQQALSLTPDQITAARQVEQAYRTLGEELASSGVLHNVLEDYMGPHLVDSAATDPAINSFRAELTAGRLSTNFRYAMKRMFETEFALEQAGKKLRTKDIFDKLTTYLEQSEHVKANRWMVKQIKDGETATGQPWIDFRATRTLPPAKPGEAPAVLVKPSKNPGNPGEYVRVDHPALRGWRWAAQDDQGRPVLVEGDAWVHRDIYPKLRNILKRSSLYNLPGLETLTSAQQNLKGMKFSGSLFHPVQLTTHLGMHLTNPFKLKPVNANSPTTMDAMNHGLKLYEHEGLEGFSSGIASTRWVNRLPVYGRLARRMAEMTFEDFFPAGKSALYDNILARNRQRYGTDAKGFRAEVAEMIRNVPGLRRLRPNLSDDDIKTVSAVQANFAMGGQPWKAMALNPEFTHALHLGFRAPDFLASRLGFVARAGTKLGAEERMALTIGTLSLWTLSRMFNMALSDDHKPHMEEPFAVVVGNRKYSIRTVMGDTLAMVKNPVQWWRNRLSPLLSTPMEFFSGINWMGKPVSHTQAVLDAATEAAPIPFTPRSDVKWYEQLDDAMGLHVSRHSAATQAYPIIHDWMSKNLPNKPNGIYPESPYLALRDALMDNDDTKAAREIQKLRSTGHKDDKMKAAIGPRPLTGSKKDDDRMMKALAPEDRVLVNKLIQERKDARKHLAELLQQQK